MTIAKFNLQHTTTLDDVHFLTVKHCYARLNFIIKIKQEPPGDLFHDHVQQNLVPIEFFVVYKMFHMYL